MFESQDMVGIREMRQDLSGGFLLCKGLAEPLGCSQQVLTTWMGHVLGERDLIEYLDRTSLVFWEVFLRLLVGRY